MRMRRKKWARPELSVCPYFMKDPSKNRGHWAEQFERPEQPFWLELGCGKGTYAARVAADHPEINLLAIDIKSDILAVARRNIQAVYAEAGRPVDNLRRVTPSWGGAAPDAAATTVAAAASVPSSLTSILAAWITWER